MSNTLGMTGELGATTVRIRSNRYEAASTQKQRQNFVVPGTGQYKLLAIALASGNFYGYVTWPMDWGIKKVSDDSDELASLLLTDVTCTQYAFGAASAGAGTKIPIPNDGITLVKGTGYYFWIDILALGSGPSQYAVAEEIAGFQGYYWTEAGWAENTGLAKNYYFEVTYDDIAPSNKRQQTIPTEREYPIVPTTRVFPLLP